MRLNREKKIKTYDITRIVELANKNKRRLVFRSMHNYKNNIERTVKSIIKTIKDKYLLLVTGPSSSGKTTTSNLIRQELEMYGYPAFVVSMDNFFINRVDTPKLPDGTYDFDDVHTVNIELFKKCMTELVETGKADLPIFDFVTGIRQDKAFCASIKKNTIIIVEGLHAFNPLCISEVMQEKAIKLYVAPQSYFKNSDGTKLSPIDLRFKRRAIRDYFHRGNSIKESEINWKNVREREEKFVVPYRKDADFLVDSVHMFEPLLYDRELLEIAKEDKDALKYVDKNIPKTPLTKDDIPQSSLIWEFLG